MALEDYGQLLRSGSAAVTDYADQEAKRQLLQIKGLEQKRLYEEQQREVADDQSFQSDLTSVLANPSAQGYAALIAKHPKKAAGLKSSWDMMDAARQKADLLSGSEIYSAAAGGKYDLAATLLQRRIDADKAAGHPPDAHDQTILDGLKSGDPTQQKAAMGMIGYGLAAVAGPDKFASTLGELTKASTPEIRSVEAGGSVAERNPVTGAWEEKYRSPYLKTADGGVLIADEKGGGQTSPGVAATAAPGGPGGFDAAVEHVIHNEGGYAPSDMNGQPVNFGINQGANPGVDVKNLTRDQAKQIYHDKYWVPSGAENLPSNLQAPYFDVYIRNPKFAKKALAQSGGDPVKFMEASSAYFQNLGKSQSGQKYAKAWANRDAKNMAIATGGTVPASSGGAPGSQTPAAPPGYRWLTPPKPKDAPSGYRFDAAGNLQAIPGGPADSTERYTILTPQEAQAQNLDPAMKWQKNLKTGQITALGGQSKQAKQIPQQVQTKVQPSIDTRDTFARLAGTWKPEYAGHTVLGDNLNTLQRTLGSWSGAPEGMAAWWADFQAMDNMVRNQLFGSALTEHEKAAYASTTITPRMDPKEVVRRFNVRRNIANAVAARQQNFLKKNGYDPEAVDAMFDPLGGGGSQRTVVRTGRRKSDGARVVQYSDGTIEVGK